ncbi:MAG TPA: hypothetical protein VF786_02075 [Terriglobales bacterium]
MLRISIVEARHERKLVLEGKLIPPWTNELRDVFERATQDLEGRELVIYAKTLTEISKEGESLLVAFRNQGAKFRCCGVFTKIVFRQLVQRARKEFQGMEK